MKGSVQQLTARRIISAGRRGSSRPIIVETEAGTRLLKLRGSGQGTGPLIAEVIVAYLAEKLGLLVPPRSLITLPKGVPTDEWDDELEDLLAASIGVNLGFDYLDGAREIRFDDAANIPLDIRSAVLWLDRLVLNLDRTARNPNILTWAEEIWLIDHGAALGFQYRWEQVTEQSPREPWAPPEAHLFDSVVSVNELKKADEVLAPKLSRSVLEQAVSEVPETFWHPLMSKDESVVKANDLDRRREAYVAFLWQRLKSPRPFLNYFEPPRIVKRDRRPSWLTDMFDR